MPAAVVVFWLYAQTQAGSQKMDCQTMMSRHTQMMSEMKAMDARLDQKVTAMNAARGQAKVDAVADVVNELVTQRREMHEKMGSMHAQMMAHMGQHMSAGPAGANGMQKCPMMQEMMREKQGAQDESPKPDH